MLRVGERRDERAFRRVDHIHVDDAEGAELGYRAYAGLQWTGATQNPNNNAQRSVSHTPAILGG